MAGSGILTGVCNIMVVPGKQCLFLLTLLRTVFPWPCPQQRAVVASTAANSTTIHTQASQGFFLLHQPVLFPLMACTYVSPLHGDQSCIYSLVCWDLRANGTAWCTILPEVLTCGAVLMAPLLYTSLTSRVSPGYPSVPVCIFFLSAAKVSPELAGRDSFQLLYLPKCLCFLELVCSCWFVISGSSILCCPTLGWVVLFLLQTSVNSLELQARDQNCSKGLALQLF